MELTSYWTSSTMIIIRTCTNAILKDGGTNYWTSSTTPTTRTCITAILKDGANALLDELYDTDYYNEILDSASPLKAATTTSLKGLYVYH